MIKKTGIVTLIMLVLITLISGCLQPGAPGQPAGPAPVSPVEPVTPVTVKELTILDSSAVAQFPAQLDFSLQAASNVTISDVRLHYTVEKEAFARVTSEVYVDFMPDTTISAQWTWDMRRTGGLPTGTIIEYWWTVKDASGAKAETAPARISFDDTRYVWKTLTENRVTIYWYEGNQSFASELMTASQQALTHLSQSTGAFLKKPVKIYIYANTRDLQGAMIFPQEWTGGAAFTEFGIITIGIATNDLVWGKRSIAHELSHLVVHQMTLNPYIGLPNWLDEGLAMYNEGDLEASFVGSLRVALENNLLISVRSLSSPFPANVQESYLSYAQSYSLVEFLVGTYGQSKMLELLNTFSQGSSYDGALKTVYGFDMDGLNTLWRVYVVKRYQAAGQSAAIPPVLNRLLEPFTGLIFDLRLASLGGAGRLI